MQSNEHLYVGADIGTTGCRSSIFSSTGRVAATASTDYPLNVPQAGWAEQDPEIIYKAFRDTLHEAISRLNGHAKSIKAIAFSTVFHSLFPVDKDGVPLHPMLTWADSRAQKYIPFLSEKMDLRSLYERTGCPLHPMYPLAKLAWFRHERPDLFERTAKFVSIKEYIIFRLTGQFVVDRSLASGTGLYNFREGGWDEQCLRTVGITREQLSPIHPTTYMVRGWESESIGLPANLPLVLGAGDGVLSTLGAGAIEPGQFTAMIGTSGAVRLPSPKPQTDWETKNWCYNLTEDLWVVGGAINNGGLALRWARDKFARTEQYVAEKLDLDPYDVLARYAERKSPGSDGLIFLPFLAGERSPYWNANARGVLFGLNLNHGKRHLMRATFEGILYSMYSVFQTLGRLSQPDGKRAVEVRASGSFTRSPFWVQMMADIFGHPITLPGEPEGSAFGAALLGMLAMGEISSLQAVRDLVGKPKSIFVPNPKNHAIYRRLFEIYGRVYSNLLNEFNDISKLQAELVRES